MPPIDYPFATKRRRTHGVWKWLVLFGVIIAASGGYVVWAAIRPLPPIRPTPLLLSRPAGNLAAPSSLLWSGYGEQAVGVIGEGVLATHGPQNPLPIASVAKVMAALAVLHQHPLAVGDQGPDVPITAADVAIYQQDLAGGQSVAAVQAGETITEYQVLQALLLPSANNMATTLTAWAFGSEDAYLAYANAYAQQLDMTQTIFADASGFSPNTVSTPSDLVRLGETAVQDPVIASIVSQPSATIPVAGTILNVDVNVQTNSGTGLNGIKTGNTDQAGGCFLYSTPFNGTTVVGVILGAPNLGTALHDAPDVAASTRNNLQLDTIVSKDQPIVRYTLPWGGQVAAVAQQSVQVIDWKDSAVPRSVHDETVVAGTEQGHDVGTLSAPYQGTNHTVSLTLTSTITTPSLWWRIRHP